MKYDHRTVVSRFIADVLKPRLPYCISVDDSAKIVHDLDVVWSVLASNINPRIILILVCFTLLDSDAEFISTVLAAKICGIVDERLIDAKTAECRHVRSRRNLISRRIRLVMLTTPKFCTAATL